MNNSTIQLPNWLTRSAENFPNHLALQMGEVRWSFAELEQRAIHLARQLATADVHEGSRVALLAANGLPYVVCIHALTLLGAILVPLNTRLTIEELCWQLQDVRASLLLCDDRYAETTTKIISILPHLSHSTLSIEAATHNIILDAYNTTTTISLRSLINLNATQSIMYTSGTTGTPKGVLITYGMHWWNAIGSALNLGHSPDDCWLACLPLFHIGGLAILMRSVINGITVILQEKFDDQAVNKAICENGVTIISVVAVMLQRMLKALDIDNAAKTYPPTLRCVLLGGGPAPRPLLEACRTRSIPVVQTYGLTEACSQAVTLAPTDALRKLGSAGRPLLPVQLTIRNEGQIVPPGEPGIICLKGPSITPGYADRPEATAQAFHDGWLSTGDIGYLDDEGYLYVLDRRNDLIISGGENVYPAEIEAVLLSHPAVQEAGVCGQPDPEWGQVPIAFVTLYKADAVTPNDLHTYLAQRLARYKRPKTITIVTYLPRNSAGKLLRRELPHLAELPPPSNP